MGDISKQVGKLIGKTVAFAAIYYLAYMFINGLTMHFYLGRVSILSASLCISVHTVVTLTVFFFFGRMFSVKANNLYWDAGFSAALLIWGTVTVLITDIDRMLKGLGALIAQGAPMPIYMLLHEIFEERINYFKYIFIIYWVLIAIAIFLGSIIGHVDERFRKKIKIGAISLLIVIAAGIPMPRFIEALKPTMFTESTYPKIDGATAAIPLGKMLARELLGKDIKEAEYFVRFNTTHEAYVNLINKDADIIFAAEPSEKERALAENAGFTLKLTPVGMDAFVFIVNKNNKIDNLSIEEIRGIYSGEIRNWQYFFGKNEEIIAYQRPSNSGSQTLMENVVMKGLTMAEPPTERIPAFMGDMINVISYKNSENAIGYTVYYYANEMNKNENIKFLSVNGIPCNKETIREKEYPFSGPLYAVTRENDDNESVTRLIEYLLSEKGQKTVEKGGFVTLNGDD